jgi:hypothetical protein
VAEISSPLHTDSGNPDIRDGDGDTFTVTFWVFWQPSEVDKVIS